MGLERAKRLALLVRFAPSSKSATVPNCAVLSACSNGGAAPQDQLPAGATDQATRGRGPVVSRIPRSSRTTPRPISDVLPHYRLRDASSKLACCRGTACFPSALPPPRQGASKLASEPLCQAQGFNHKSVSPRARPRTRVRGARARAAGAPLVRYSLTADISCALRRAPMLPFTVYSLQFIARTNGTTVFKSSMY